jgi:hypothetical protein
MYQKWELPYESIKYSISIFRYVYKEAQNVHERPKSEEVCITTQKGFLLLTTKNM